VDTSRNHRILDGVAETFVEAVTQFLEHPTLRYQWMRFLPDDRSDSLWGSVSTKIKMILENTPVVFPRKHNEPSLIRNLRIIPERVLDIYGEPFFDVSSRSGYLAPEYEAGEDISKLVSLGLRNLSIPDFIEIVEQDIKLPTSKLKSPSLHPIWYRQVAKFLLNRFEGQKIHYIKPLKLVPLNNGSLVSILEGPIYFPETDGIRIPTDLGLRLVLPDSIKENASARNLFSSLGVKSAPVMQVRQLIFAKYTWAQSREGITLDQSVSHVSYLYWTHLASPIFGNIFSRDLQGKYDTNFEVTTKGLSSSFQRLNFSTKDTPEISSVSSSESSKAESHDFTRATNNGQTSWTKDKSTDTNQARPTSNEGPATLFMSSSFTSSFTGISGAAGMGKWASVEQTNSTADPFSTIIHRTIVKDSLKSFSSPAVATQSGIQVDATSCSGTREAPFEPLVIKEDQSLTPESFQSICSQEPYQKFSYEELRLADYLSRGIRSQYSHLWIWNHDMEMVPLTFDIYLESDDEFGLQAKNPEFSGLIFLNNSYSLSNSSRRNFGGVVWEKWLEEQLGILRYPRLTDPNDPTKLSHVFQQITCWHPEKMLGTLKAHWFLYVSLMNDAITQQISQVIVPCKGGITAPLKDTFQPYLESSMRTFLRQERFRFLLLPPTSSPLQWMFLSKFNVGGSQNFDFYLEVLKTIRVENPAASKISDPERISELYKEIQEHYRLRGKSTEDRDRIR
jgi:hypothetical protein